MLGNFISYQRNKAENKAKFWLLCRTYPTILLGLLNMFFKIYIVVLMTLLPHPKGLYGTSTRKEIFNNHLFLSPFPIATLIVTPRV